jgi:hypothetical protein
MGTFSETPAAGAGVQAATPNLQGLSTSTDPLLNSEFSTVSTLNPGLGSIYGTEGLPRRGYRTSAQGFNPGNPQNKGFALKGREMRVPDEARTAPHAS